MATTRYLPEPAPVVTPDRLITRPWAQLFERLIGDVVVAGTGASWGSITGSLAAQGDLVAALAAAAGGGVTAAAVRDAGYWSPLTDGVDTLIYADGDTIATWTATS